MYRKYLLTLALIGLIALAISACTAGGAAEPTEPPITEEPTTAPTTPPTTETTEQPTDAPATELVGTAWTLTQINGSAPLPYPQASLSFEATTLGGKVCNDFGGNYTASGGTIQVTEVISTLMLCTEPAGLMDLETNFLAALQEATHYTLTGDQLTLGTEANPSTLVFTAGLPATATPPAPSGEWLTYTDAETGFEVSYPDSGIPINANPLPIFSENSVRIDLPLPQGTNLQEKYLQIDHYQDVVLEECVSPQAEGFLMEDLNIEQVSLHGKTWLKHGMLGAAAGNRYEWVAYSTVQDTTCVVLTFMLHSVTPENFPTPPAEFDHGAEVGVFDEILATFRWLP